MLQTANKRKNKLLLHLFIESLHDLEMPKTMRNHGLWSLYYKIWVNFDHSWRDINFIVILAPPVIIIQIEFIISSSEKSS